MQSLSFSFHFSIQKKLVLCRYNVYLGAAAAAAAAIAAATTTVVVVTAVGLWQLVGMGWSA